MKELLSSELKGNKLSNKINYAVFGLGDSAYVYFNEAANIWDTSTCVIDTPLDSNQYITFNESSIISKLLVIVV